MMGDAMFLAWVKYFGLADALPILLANGYDVGYVIPHITDEYVRAHTRSLRVRSRGRNDLSLLES